MTDTNMQQINDIECESCAVKYNGDEDRSGQKISSEMIKISIAALIFISGLILRQFDQILLSNLILIVGYFIAGWGVLRTAFNNIRKNKWFDESFLMSISTLGALAIGEVPEAVGVMLFYLAGEMTQERALKRSRRSIEALVDLKPDKANLIQGKGVVQVSPESVPVGGMILIRVGERIPLDGIVIEGETALDTKAITGESLPREVLNGDEVMAGMVNLNSEIKVKVTKPYDQSSIAKIIEMVRNAGDRKARTERFITRFAKIYTPIIVLIAASYAIFSPMLIPGQTYSESIYRALVIMMISCPCALVISIPLGYFGGIGGASKKGILVKGATFLDILANVKTVIFDKTGTLTKGEFSVKEINAFNGLNEEQIFEKAANLAAHSNHHISRSIFAAFSGEVDHENVKDFTEFPGMGIAGNFNGDRVTMGNQTLFRREKIEIPEGDYNGTILHVAVNREYCGNIVIGDEIKDNSRQAVLELRKEGVKYISMLSGDHQKTTAEVARELKVDAFQAEMLPEEKVQELERIMAANDNGKVAFIGDGINDAPALAIADVGIVMGAGGADVAVESADVVLLNDDPETIVEAIRLGKRTRNIVWQNILIALTIKAVFIVLGLAGAANMWQAVFADVGVAVLAIFNSIRVLK